jgi:hypothetical protein
VTLSWGADPQAQGFRVFWSNGYRVVYLGTVNAATTSVTIAGLRPGSSSYFLVEAFNSTSHADSRWVQVTTPLFSTGNNLVFSEYAQLQPNRSGWGGNSTSAAATTTSSHWGRGRF